jgi:PAS domain S-box-containing protein
LTVIESLPHVVYEQQLNGEMIYMSPKLRALTGYRVEEVLRGEVPFESIIHPEDRDRWRRNLLRFWPSDDVLSLDVLARSAAARPIEYRLIHRDGREIIWVADHSVARMRNPNETVSAPLRNEDLLVVGTLVDLRQRKRLEIEALQRSRLATIGELAASVAHEINNPLTAVLTYGQLLDRWFKRQIFPDTEARKGQEYLRHIIEQGRAIDTITRNLTGFVRKTSEEDLQPVNIGELIRTALAIFRYPLKRERIALDIKIDPNLPPIRARAGQLRQVLLNLVANARSSLNIRYPDDESHVDKRIEIDAQLNKDKPGYLRLAIRDWGEGIPDDLKEKVFDAFFSTRKDGTGLGLSIVTSILEQHEALIELDSTLGEGTTFRIDLPVWTSPTRDSGSRSLIELGDGEASAAP